MTADEIKKTMKHFYPNEFLELDFYPNIFFGVNAIFVLLSLPIVNFIVIPCAPKLTIRARIAIGMVLYLAGDIAAIIIHSADLVHNPHGNVTRTQLICLLVPIAIFAIAEALTIVSGIIII